MKMTYVDGVIFVKSLPTVSMTRRPHSHNPTDIPIPPNIKMNIGVGDCCIADPSLNIIQMAINGPIALLKLHIFFY